MTASPDHTSRAHSKLGASIAHRWMACPGSVRLSAGVEESAQTMFAAEGTAAHELCERCLEADFADAGLYLGEVIKVGEFEFTVDEEMAEAVNVYVDEIKGRMLRAGPTATLLVEQKFDLTHVYPGMFGTGDCGLYDPVSKTLAVLDYKHGRGHAVDADHNPQLAYYGLGMVALPNLHNVPIEHVELVIVQPRAPHKDGAIRVWKTDPLHLLDFQADLAEAAAKTAEPDAPLVAGEHCTFCPAAGICPALRKVAIDDAMAEFADVIPSDLSEQQIAVLLEKTDLIEDGIRAIRREAFNRAAGGAKIPGWKLVDKRATRKWRDEGAAASKLVVEHDLSTDDIWTRKLKSPAQVEKLLSKQDRAALAELVIAESSGTTLARETDRRAEATPSRSAAVDFDPVE